MLPIDEQPNSSAANTYEARPLSFGATCHNCNRTKIYWVDNSNKNQYVDVLRIYVLKCVCGTFSYQRRGPINRRHIQRRNWLMGEVYHRRPN